MGIIPLYFALNSRDPSHILINTERNKFRGPAMGPYEKSNGIGKTPAAGPCEVKGLKVVIKKMATASGGIDFIFLGPPPKFLDPLLCRFNI